MTEDFGFGDLTRMARRRDKDVDSAARIPRDDVKDDIDFSMDSHDFFEKNPFDENETNDSQRVKLEGDAKEKRVLRVYPEFPAPRIKKQKKYNVHDKNRLVKKNNSFNPDLSSISKGNRSIEKQVSLSVERIKSMDSIENKKCAYVNDDLQNQRLERSEVVVKNETTGISLIIPWWLIYS